MAAVDLPTSSSAGATKPCLHAQPMQHEHQHQQSSHNITHLNSHQPRQQQQQPHDCLDPPVLSSSPSNGHQNGSSSSHQSSSSSSSSHHNHHHLPFGHWDLGPGDIHLRGHPEVLLGYFMPGAVGGVALEAGERGGEGGKAGKDEKGTRRSFSATYCLVPWVGWRGRQVRRGRVSGQGEEG